MARKFLPGFSVGLIIFIAINLTSAHLASDCGLAAVFGRDSCADDIARAGWPICFYEAGGFDSRYNFSVVKLGLDLVIGVLIASAIAWLSVRRVR